MPGRPAVVKAKGGVASAPECPLPAPSHWRRAGESWGKIAKPTKCCLIAFPLTERETEAPAPATAPPGPCLGRPCCRWHSARLHHTEPDGGQWGEDSDAGGRLAAGLGLCPPPAAGSSRPWRYPRCRSKALTPHLRPVHPRRPQRCLRGAPSSPSDGRRTGQEETTAWRVGSVPPVSDRISHAEM